MLLAPLEPEQAELVTPEHVTTVVNALRTTHDLVVVDAWPWLNDTTMTFLDQSDLIVALLTLEISIKNLRQFLEPVSTLGYPDDKLRLVLNRADSAYGIRAGRRAIDRSQDRHSIVSDGQTVVYALNRGVPFVLGNRYVRVSQDVIKLTKSVAGEALPAENVTKATAQPAQRKALLAWR